MLTRRNQIRGKENEEEEIVPRKLLVRVCSKSSRRAWRQRQPLNFPLPTAINPTTSNPIPSGIRPVCPDGNLGGSGSGFGPSQPRKRRRAEDADSDDSTLGEHFQNHAGNYVSSSGFRLDSHSHYNPIPAPIFPGTLFLLTAGKSLTFESIAASSGLLELVWPELSAPLPLSNDIVEGHNYGRKGGRSEEADSEDPRAGKRFHADGRNVQADFDPFPGLPHLRGLPPTPVSWNHLINHTSPVVGYPAFDHNPTQGCHEPSSGPNPDRKRRRTQTPDASTGRGGNKRTKMKTKEATPPDFSPPNLALPDMHSERFDLTYQPRSVGELSAGYPNIAHGRSGEFPPWDVDVQFSSADGQTIPNQPSSSRIQVEFQPQSRPNTRNTAASRALTRQTNRLPKKPNASSQGSYDDEAVGTSRVRFTPRSRLCSEVGTSTYTALRRKSPPTETVPQKRTTRRRKSLGPSPSVCNSEPGMSTLVALTQPKGTIPCPHGCSDVMFTRKADLKRHLEGGRHQGKTASCPLCGEEKSRPCAVRRHLKNVHSVKDKTDVDRIMAMGKTNLKADEKKEMQQKRKKKKLAEKEQDLDWDDDDDDNFEQAPEEGNDRDEGEFGTE
ncbi:hypothetical protein MSAN_00955700 [Mycena sanguinolenta]|uniref:C2H2-type domain-containing protein n=1 Tax=Mycena sanguinolenta TaxID=230812 RepID=A0A8H7DA65_9AGAR|nr:hypothetical protein MSAN_00955700 [Mycena sanguinolenta]